MIEKHIARGFLARQLSSDQITQVREAESLLPPNQSWSLLHILKLTGLDFSESTLDPAEIIAMEKCWGEFWKTVLGPTQAFEESIHPEGCTMFTCKHPWDDRCKTKSQEMWQWEDFVLRHYKSPQVAGRKLAETFA